MPPALIPVAYGDAMPPDATAPPPASVVPLRTTRLAAALLGVTAMLLATDLLLKLVTTPQGRWQELRNLFSVSNESNVPTFWNAALLVLVSVACAVVALLADRTRTGWTVASLTSFALAADETVRGHERLRSVSSQLGSWLPLEVPTYSWLLPGALLALAGATAAWAWTSRLPRSVRTGLRLALVVYGTGALGFEALSGMIETRSGIGVEYALATLVEEGLEMTACAIALVAVLRMLGTGMVGPRRAVLVPVERDEGVAP